ncbi:MAG: efflux RND transporter permease subunit [Methylohalobius sp. ZOD2]
MMGRGWIRFFVRHAVAANLFMVMMLLGGLYALDKLNVQFFPNFTLDIVRVSVSWLGASAEDVEDGLTTPLEQALKSVDDLRQMTSTSAEGVSSITLEFEEGTDILLALNQVKQRVDEFRNLPRGAEDPTVTQAARYEPVARLILYGARLKELRPLAHRFERELMGRGIDKVDIVGLPEEEVAIEFSDPTLNALGLSLDQVAERIDSFSRDIPAGHLGDRETLKVLRVTEQRRAPSEFARIPVTSGTERVELGSVASIRRQPRPNSTHLSFRDQPAVELRIRRAEHGDSLKSAEAFAAWLAETKPNLPATVRLHVYDETWHLIRERINLLLKNGAGGLVLVVLILYLFLTGRVAFWVALGIPVSFMATLLILYAAGGSINMISLFGLIMALGIIVDDAIVVGEDALTHYQSGDSPLDAAESGGKRMLAPVMASSLTTVAAFLPLMLVGGPTGKILFAIPLVVVSVIGASLLESFWVLPAHLRYAFERIHGKQEGEWRRRLDQGFQIFRETYFRPLARAALNHRGLTLACAVALLIASLGLVAGKRVQFVFFTAPEADMLQATVAFVPGTVKERLDHYLANLEAALHEAEAELSPDRPLVRTALQLHGQTLSTAGALQQQGDHLGAMVVELMPSETRSVRSWELIEAWRARIAEAPGLDNLSISARQVGPPGRDVSVRLTGDNADRLKQAASDLVQALEAVPGLSDVTSDLPYGREQWIYRLTSVGEMLGLTPAEIGRQLRTAFSGRLVQIFQDGADEVEVRVRLAEMERSHLDVLNTFQVRLPGGERVPLHTVARADTRQGFEVLRHASGRLAVEVSAEIDTRVNKPDLVMETLDDSVLPQLARRYGIDYQSSGRAEDRAETLADMKKGGLTGLVLIYLILAWVFGSYGWPLVVMVAIPFGLVGAIFGHWIMGLDLTILSLFGIFGLSGIVVNDSIILVSFYRDLRAQGWGLGAALEEAACQRLRAVLLTSLTTIAGLLPLLFETSLQAKFLIPMAVSIAFGLLFATALVLLVIPALLGIYEHKRVGSHA